METKKKLGRPVVDSEPVMIRMPAQMIEAIDEYRRSQKDLPSRPEVIRRVMSEWLSSLGTQEN